ncbi:hypothetical protein EI94DRAFT_1805488 [Lactarius quietus]|nr:hypothetical protein EI94DRAFT_1805488 [Lactarius quietus]
MSRELDNSQSTSTTSGNDPPHAVSQEQHPEDGNAVLHDLRAHYWMPKTCASSQDFTKWLIDNQEDRALQDFRRRLLDHLLARIQGVMFQPNATFSTALTCSTGTHDLDKRQRYPA